MFSIITGFMSSNKLATALGIVLALVLVYTGFQYLNIKNLEIEVLKKEKKIKSLKGDLELQNKLIEINKVNYEKNLATSKKKQIEIKNKYSNIFDRINSYKEDTNVSKCQNAYNYINSFVY